MEKEMIVEWQLKKFFFEFKNGKGFRKKVTSYGDLIFEGEYLYGEKNGKGKDYYLFHKLEFEGEYLNGKKWNGKGYDFKRNIIYELNNGKGFISEYYPNGKLKCEGEYLNGEKNGRGKEYYPNGKLKFKENI